MTYKVLNDFREKDHKNTVYQAGDIYPKDGFKAKKERVEYLQKKHPKYGVAFLATEGPKNEKKDKAPEVKDPEEVQDKEPVKKTSAKGKKSDAK